ncbi:unnamed protein product, partial [Ectocarpus sp. 13 AM-2016]
GQGRRVRLRANGHQRKQAASVGQRAGGQEGGVFDHGGHRDGGWHAERWQVQPDKPSPWQSQQGRGRRRGWRGSQAGGPRGCDARRHPPSVGLPYRVQPAALPGGHARSHGA